MRPDAGVPDAGVPDAVVVGAGIVGAACARELAREGLRVVILDSRFAGGGSTSAGMGHVVAMDDSPAQLALTGTSCRLWAELAPRLPAPCEDDPCGTLWVAADEEEMAAVHAKAATYGAAGIACEVLDGARTAALEPHLRPGLSGSLLVPGDRVVYPPNVARFLLDEAVRAGAVRREGLEALAIGSGRVRTREGELLAGVVVVAAGVDSPRLLPGLPVEPRKGHLVITERGPSLVRHQIVELGYLKSAHGGGRGASVAFNVQPRRPAGALRPSPPAAHGTGQVLVGSSREYAGLDPTVNRAVLGRMLERAFAYMPVLSRVSALRVWTGFRPATPDKLPVIGPWPRIPGVFVAAGHEGLGITTSLATAELLRDLVLGRRPNLDPGPFSPARVLPLPEIVA